MAAFGGRFSCPIGMGVIVYGSYVFGMTHCDSNQEVMNHFFMALNTLKTIQKVKSAY